MYASICQLSSIQLGVGQHGKEPMVISQVWCARLHEVRQQISWVGRKVLPTELEHKIITINKSARGGCYGLDGFFTPKVHMLKVWSSTCNSTEERYKLFFFSFSLCLKGKHRENIITKRDKHLPSLVHCPNDNSQGWVRPQSEPRVP